MCLFDKYLEQLVIVISQAYNYMFYHQLMSDVMSSVSPSGKLHFISSWLTW